MNVNDIPQEMLNQIRLRFESTPEVRALRTKQQYAQRTGAFVEALEIAKRIDALFPIVLQAYMDHAESEVMTFDTESSDVPQKDKDEMMEKLMVLFMACDMIDSAVIDLNDILHRTKPDIDISTFSDIRQTSEMARAKLKLLQETGDYMKDLVWADTCDNMYDMMNNKARSVIRKRRESKNWGENAKKLENRV